VITARTKARKRALDILFAAEAQGIAATDLLDERIASGDLGNPYTAELVRGVAAHAQRIDELLTEYSRDWPLDRMPAVDRNVLRLGVFELLGGAEDVPSHVAISEAVELSQALSTDESPQFVNGVLGAIERDRPALS
jgi:N utilization substance protein B